jgi:hypothetical protein
VERQVASWGSKGMEFTLQLAQIRIFERHVERGQKQRRKRIQAKRHSAHYRDMPDISGDLKTRLGLATRQRHHFRFFPLKGRAVTPDSSMFQICFGETHFKRPLRTGRCCRGKLPKGRLDIGLDWFDRVERRTRRYSSVLCQIQVRMWKSERSEVSTTLTFLNILTENSSFAPLFDRLSVSN